MQLNCQFNSVRFVHSLDLSRRFQFSSVHFCRFVHASRCDQTEYQVDKDLEDQLKDKTVCCRTDGCSYKAPLRFYLLHSHGRTNYSNADVDFSRIQAEQRRLLALPSLAALEGGGNVAAGAVDIREQLLQACLSLAGPGVTALAMHIHCPTSSLLKQKVICHRTCNRW